MSLKNKHILIAGGAGFIGSHLCEYFLTRDFRVTCVDNLLTGQKGNVQVFEENPLFSFLNHDIAVPFKMKQDVHVVINMASPASPSDYQRYPMETLRVGAFGTWNLLELSRIKKATFLLASTSEVYGDPKVHPQPEDYWGHVNPVGPRSCYDEAKRYAESLTLFYGRQYGVETRIARIFNTYGPKMRLNDGRALPNFVTQALQQKNLTIYGDGSQTRSFCYVYDLVQGLDKLLFSEEKMPVNLGNPVEKTLLEFAKLVLKLVKGPSQIVYCPLPPDDPRVRQPDIAKARRLLNWEPKTELEEGLKKTIPYFREQLRL